MAFYGDLGSGKTTSVKAIAKNLGIKENITSPTFVISKSYTAESKHQIKKLTHIDAYRLEHPSLEEAESFDEIFNTVGNLTIIEWPENIEEILPERTKRVKFSHLGGNKRAIKVDF